MAEDPTQRFNDLLDAMLNKPPLDVLDKPEPEDSDDLCGPEDD
jgi:hypothetical protein